MNNKELLRELQRDGLTLYEYLILRTYNSSPGFWVERDIDELRDTVRNLSDIVESLLKESVK